ncbi:MAG: FAD-linked oxidase [Candidatus Binatia bacterium]|nr:MAG: FAD-linked oxidase [Candidatus Binatia bacterium]
MKQIDKKAAEVLRSGFRGTVLLPHDEEYDAARRVWNAMFDRRPAVIARCLGTRDVSRAISFAREHGLLLSVRGGGHNSAGTAVCDGGMMLDLSLMRRVTVDPGTRTARADGGALLGDLDAETQLHGLAVPAGVVSHTGVGGLTLGGGFGWISRKHGLSVDNLLRVELVTADGERLEADEKTNEDLFWALRGGGGNFGVVTSFTFRCAEIGKHVYSGLLVKRFEDAGRFLAFYRDYVRGLPDEMTVWVIVRCAPPLPFLSADVHGKLVVIVAFVWLGDPGQGERRIRPLRDATPSHGEAVGANGWCDWQSSFDGLSSHGARNYWKSHHLGDLTDRAIERVVEFAASMPTDECEIFVPHMEGAPSRVEPEATAYAHRRAPFVLNIHTRWREARDDERCTAWARDFHSATEPFARGVYVNFLGDEGQDRVRAAYTPEVWSRLVGVKKKYDPENFFRMNQNIPPS